MAAFKSAGRGRVFISYRREDSAFPAGWLYDRLCAHLGGDHVFKDVDSIDPGDDFVRVIGDAVGSCQVLLALIGDRWLDITDGTGQRRLDDPEDFVRLEIEAALRRDVRVIPILVGRAPLPRSEQLPDSLRGLIRRQAIELSPNRFEPDVARLVRTIDKTLAAIGEGPADAPTPVDRTSRWPGPAATDRPEAPAEGRGNLLADPHWADALSAFFAKRWVEAVQRFEALQESHPGEGRVETRLEEARRRRDIAAWLAKAEAAAAEGDWGTAATALENLTALDPAYPDAADRLEQARTAQRRKALVDDMTALHQAGQWEVVVAASDELARLEPENPDPGGIVSDAQAKIREADLADRYAQALNHLDQKHWPQAADLFAAIEREQPGYRDAAALLKTAQGQRDLAAWSDQAEAAAGHDDWDTALTALENICAVDATYRDAGARLEQARIALRRQALVDKVTALHQAGRWKDVVAVADELAQLDPDDPDPDRMVSDARAKLREAELADRYAQGVNHLQLAHWQGAIRAFTAIEQEQPGYRDADALLKTAQQELRETAEVTQRATPPRQPLSQTTTPAPPRTTTPPVPVAVQRRWRTRSWLVTAVSIVVVGVALVGGLTILAVVQSSKSSNTSTSTSTSTSTATTSAPSPSAQASGPNETIADYIKKNNIQETTITHGAPGAPTIDLPVPEGWTRIPEGADAQYFGIVFNTPTNPDDPPKIVAIVEKLTGNVDTDKLLAVASGEVKNLPGYNGGDGKKGTLSGHPTSQLGGPYTKNGVTRMVAQNTVVIKSEDGIYLLQLNAEGPEADADALRAATGVIVQKTTITP